MGEMEKVCLDPGHDAGNLANKSPDGTYYEHAFTLDLGKRLEKLLTDRGVSVTMTRTGGGAVSLARRCEIANSIPDLDLFVMPSQQCRRRGRLVLCQRVERLSLRPRRRRERAAQDILEQVRAAGIAVRSTPIVYDPELYVLKHTKGPGRPAGKRLPHQPGGGCPAGAGRLPPRSWRWQRPREFWSIWASPGWRPKKRRTTRQKPGPPWTG